MTTAGQMLHRCRLQAIGEVCLIIIGADDFAAVACSKATPDIAIGAVFCETDGTIHQECVHAAWVITASSEGCIGSAVGCQAKAAGGEADIVGFAACLVAYECVWREKSADSGMDIGTIDPLGEAKGRGEIAAIGDNLAGRGWWQNIGGAGITAVA